MTSIPCYILDGRELYFEKELVSFNGFPIFFLCKDREDFYLALCIDYHDDQYGVISVTKEEVYQLLNGRIPIRDIFLNQDFFWHVFENSRAIIRKPISELDRDSLTGPGVCFEILTNDMKHYVKNFNQQFFHA